MYITYHTTCIYFALPNTCRDPEYCFIKSEANEKVMDIKGGDDDEEARIILYKQRDEDNDNQLWYEDRNGFIRSKISDFVFDTFGGYNVLYFTLILGG